MRVAASVSVKPGGEKPARETLEEAARLLSAAGFEVLRIGRFAVSVKGEPADFARVLGVAVEPDKSLSAPAKPAQAELRALVDKVEIASAPKAY
jgi:hypothetical protein